MIFLVRFYYTLPQGNSMEGIELAEGDSLDEVRESFLVWFQVTFPNSTLYMYSVSETLKFNKKNGE